MESASAHDSDTAPTPRVYNDLYFGRPEPSPLFDTWGQFSRLPVELRLQIWLLVLRRHRMLEITIWPADHEEVKCTYPHRPRGTGPRYYTERNHLGNVISSRGYKLEIEGRGYAATFSPILWVNRESRDAALRHYYRVHLPFPHQHAARTLYLNPEHDVLYLHPGFQTRRRDLPPPPRFARPLTLLADFLHDVKAFDPKDQGAMHVALSRLYFDQLLGPPPLVVSGLPLLTPAFLHRLAAASFAEILRSRLRSVLFPVRFKNNRRVMGISFEERYHFAQNFPLCRRGAPTGDFLWFASDPRPGVALDLREVGLNDHIPTLARAWKELEKAFGIEERSPDDRFRIYVCPSLDWPRHRNPRDPPEDEVATSEGLRQALAIHLREEDRDWDRGRAVWDNLVASVFHVPDQTTPRHGLVGDAETFEMMERLPCTAFGLWLFPIEVFKEPIRFEGSNRFNLQAYPPPGLFLFEV